MDEQLLKSYLTSGSFAGAIPLHAEITFDEASLQEETTFGHPLLFDIETVNAGSSLSEKFSVNWSFLTPSDSNKVHLALFSWLSRLHRLRQRHRYQVDWSDFTSPVKQLSIKVLHDKHQTFRFDAEIRINVDLLLEIGQVPHFPQLPYEEFKRLIREQ